MDLVNSPHGPLCTASRRAGELCWVCRLPARPWALLPLTAAQGFYPQQINSPLIYIRSPVCDMSGRAGGVLVHTHIVLPPGTLFLSASRAVLHSWPLFGLNPLCRRFSLGSVLSQEGVAGEGMGTQHTLQLRASLLQHSEAEAC